MIQMLHFYSCGRIEKWTSGDSKILWRENSQFKCKELRKIIDRNERKKTFDNYCEE